MKPERMPKGTGMKAVTMRKIRCVALDLDRTTLDGQGRLSEGNRNALLQAMANGVHIVVASGRSFATLPQDILNLPGIEYAVTGNGAAMYHVPTGKCLCRYLLKEKDIMAILDATASWYGNSKADTGKEAALEECITYEAFVDGAAYADRAYVENPAAFGATPQAVEYIKRTRNLVEDIRAFILAHCKEMDSMDIVVSRRERQSDIWQAIEACAEEIYITSSIPQLIEISYRDAGKHSGVKYIMERLGLRREEIAAFGDADNDVDMLFFAGCGIAMENASPKCKAAADYITRSHREDGVAYGLREILHVI